AEQVRSGRVAVRRHELLLHDRVRAVEARVCELPRGDVGRAQLRIAAARARERDHRGDENDEHDRDAECHHERNAVFLPQSLGHGTEVTAQVESRATIESVSSYAFLVVEAESTPTLMSMPTVCSEYWGIAAVVKTLELVSESATRTRVASVAVQSVEPVPVAR